MAKKSENTTQITEKQAKKALNANKKKAEQLLQNEKEIREIPVGSLIGLIASLIYFLSPVDLIPDIFPGIGYIDDLTVIAIAIRFAYTDIEDFKKWQQEQEQKDSEKEESQLDDVK